MSKKRSTRRSLEPFRELPIQTPEELLQAMSAGADTCCKAAVISMSPELAEYLLEYEDFPLSSAEDAADTIVERAGL